MAVPHEDVFIFAIAFLKNPGLSFLPFDDSDITVASDLPVPCDDFSVPVAVPYVGPVFLNGDRAFGLCARRSIDGACFLQLCDYCNFTVTLNILWNYSGTSFRRGIHIYDI